MIRLNEGGRPRQLRAELAGIINCIAADRGLETVEWRSFEARGIERAPGTHDGPRVRAARERREDAEAMDWLKECERRPERAPRAPETRQRGPTRADYPRQTTPALARPTGPSPDAIRAASRLLDQADERRRRPERGDAERG